MSPGSRPSIDRLEDAAHDLAAARLGQHVDEVELADHRDRAELAAHRGEQLLSQLVGRLVALLQHDEGGDHLAAQLVGPAVTPASATAGWRRNAVSTSIVPMRWAAILMISSARPLNQT